MRQVFATRLLGRWAPLLAVAFVAWGMFVTRARAVVAGDGPEYLMMLESWFRHGSPDQRPEDAAYLAPLLARHGYALATAYGGYFPDFAGRFYSYHFWLYPLLAVPARALLRVVGVDQLEAFHLTNLVLLAATIVVTVRMRSLSPARRALFLLLAALGPLLWYVRWPHTEVFTWALVMLALPLLAERRFAWATGLLAVAATQNASMLFLVAASIGLSMGARRWRTTVASCAAALPCVLPPAFYGLHFRRVNLMAESGLLDAGWVSTRRMTSFVFDLDQGMLVHMPAAVVLGAIGLGFAVRARAWSSVVLAAATACAMLATTTTVNWNAGACGMLRYGIWVAPVLAWLAARWLPSTRASWGLAAPLFALQALHVPSRNGEDDSLGHSPLAGWVLANAPSLYDPVPEIFAERTLEQPTDAPWHPLPLPIGFVDGDRVTKLLMDRDAVAALPSVYDVDATYAEQVRVRFGHAEGMFYLEPPRGTVRPRSPPTPAPSRSTFGLGVTLGDGWLPVHHDDKGTWACTRRRATVRLEAPASGHVVSLRAWPLIDRLGHPVRLRIQADGAVLDDRPVFGRVAVHYAVDAGVAEISLETSESIFTVEDGVDVGLCVDSLASE